MATDRYGKYACMISCNLYLCLASTLERQKWHIIVPSISPCCYLQVQVMYLDELYRECSGTARTCMNNGYQVLLSDFVKCLGMRS